MGLVIKSYEPTFWDKLYFPALIKGLMVTLRYFFKRKITIQYPDEKYIPPDGYRGLHRLNKYEDGRIRCVACDMCAAACPADCIEIDLLTCIFCGFCEMACPEEAIELTEIYDFSAFTREDLIIDREGLLDVYEMTKDQNYYSRQNKNSKPEI